MEKNFKDMLFNLVKNRNVNDTFIERLETVGIKIEYGYYSYWNSCPYVKIGNEKVFLVESKTYNNNTSCCDRKQIDVIENIIEAIAEQSKELEKEDKVIEDFFEKLSANN